MRELDTREIAEVSGAGIYTDANRAQFMIHRTPTFFLWILRRIGLPCASAYPSGSFASCFLINAADFLITWGTPFFIYCVASGQSRSTTWLLCAVAASSVLYGLVVATSIRRSAVK